MSDLGTTFSLVGYGLVLAGLILVLRTLLFLRGAANTEGRVVDFETSTGSRGGTTYKPVVEYAAPDGQIHRFTHSLASNPPRFQVGEMVPIKYDPNRPEKARINRPYHMWFLPVFLIMMGATSLAADLIP